MPKRKSISPAMRKRVLDRDGHACVKCKDTEGPFQLDHKISISKSGPHTDGNLETLCHECHKFKTARDMQDLRKIKNLEKARLAHAEVEERMKKPKRKIASPGWGNLRQKMNGEITEREE